MDVRKGLLLKRKDFLGVDEEAGSHPNRTYYFKKNADLDKIVATCTKSLQNDPHNKKALLLRGSTLLKMQQYQDAANDFTMLLNIDPQGSVDMYYSRGMAYTKLGHQDRAIDDFTTVLSRNPDHVNALFARAACYNTIGQFSAAIEDYNVALLKDQSQSSYREKSPEKRWLSSGGASERATGMSPSTEGGSPTHEFKMGSTSRPDVNGGMSPIRTSHTKDSTGQEKETDTSMLLPQRSDYASHSRQNSSTSSAGSNTHPSRTVNNSPRPPAGADAEEHHRAGYEHRKKGDFARAIVEYSRAIQIDPRHFKALFNRAFAYDKVGRYNDAVEDYTRALAVEPENPFAYYNRGISHDRQGYYEEACKDFRHAIALQPRNMDFMHNLALCLRKMGNIEEAIQAYTTCLEIDPTHVKARHSRGLCYEKIGRNQDALEDYDAVLAAHPHHIPCLTCKAHVLHNTGGHRNLHQAVRAFSAVLDVLYPDGKSMARDQSSGSRREDAIGVIHARAKVYEDMGDVGSAIRDATLAIDLAQERDMQNLPDTAVSLPLSSLYNTRALYYKSAESYDEAAQDFTLAIEFIRKEGGGGDTALSEELSTLLVSALNHRGYCWRKLDDFSKAIADYSQAISVQPSSVRGYNNRAYCLAKLGRYADAVEDYTAVIGLDPSNSHAYHNRGISLDKLGQFDKAIEDFTKVIELDAADNKDTPYRPDYDTGSSVHQPTFGNITPIRGSGGTRHSVNDSVPPGENQHRIDDVHPIRGSIGKVESGRTSRVSSAGYTSRLSPSHTSRSTMDRRTGAKNTSYVPSPNNRSGNRPQHANLAEHSTRPSSKSTEDPAAQMLEASRKLANFTPVRGTSPALLRQPRHKDESSTARRPENSYLKRPTYGVDSHNNSLPPPPHNIASVISSPGNRRYESSAAVTTRVPKSPIHGNDRKNSKSPGKVMSRFSLSGRFKSAVRADL